ncbi:hypothetical protein WJX84_005548 [Apatococcus fuscideae]|uniref:Uncharacterized protein n=1 Tax=Apatococcus fuscideae TaxID=2026836 RepID=A0AAW1SYH5_9CHLO
MLDRSKSEAGPSFHARDPPSSPSGHLQDAGGPLPGSMEPAEWVSRSASRQPATSKWGIADSNTIIPKMGAAYEMPDGQRNLRKHRREEADHDISDLGCSPQKQLHK